MAQKLLDAARLGDSARMKVLLMERGAGANVNVGDTSGYTPLHAAAEHGHVECVKVCVQRCLIVCASLVFPFFLSLASVGGKSPRGSRGFVRSNAAFACLRERACELRDGTCSCVCLESLLVSLS